MAAGRWILFMTSSPAPPLSNPEHRRPRDAGVPGPRHPDAGTAGGARADGLVNQGGTPGMIVSANGTEFTCNAMLA
jgi:hypothetical protein